MEKEIPAPWVRLITFCMNEIPFGEVSIKIVDGLPSKLLSSHREIRFDKEAYFPETGKVKGRGLDILKGD